MYRGGQPYKKTAGAQRGPNNLAVTAGVVRCRSSLDLVGFPVGAAHRENLAKLPQVYRNISLNPYRRKPGAYLINVSWKVMFRT